MSTEGESAGLQDTKEPGEPDPELFDTGVAHPARVCTDRVATATSRLNARMGPAQLHRRTREQMAGYDAGLDMVEPGLVPLPEWRALANPAHLIPCYAGIGRKP